MHLGVIPDGNRRYADNNGIKNKEAYRRAKNVIEEIGRKINDSSMNVNEVTFYLLSEENLKRDKEELEALFDLLEEYIEEISREYGKNGFEFNWARTMPDEIPDRLKEKLKNLEEQHSEGERKLNLLISYTGKQDILNAAEKISSNGGDFSKKSLRDHLEIESDIDFVIRTGDNPTRECLSGFPIWNSSYSEFHHIKKNFPAVDYSDIEESLEHYRKLRKKRGE